MKYTNHKGDEVDISILSDKDLVLSHRWFQRYCKIIANVRLGNGEDNQYSDYVSSMVVVRDALRAEIKSRKLKMSLF